MKLATVVGARPQFIKAATVTRAIHAFNESSTGGRSKKAIEEVLIHTGQHYDYRMNQVFFEELELPRPQYHLEVGSASHGRQTALMLERIEAVLQKERPDVVVVYGDTNSTLAGALSGAKLNLRVAHVEAGLRSYNRAMPEEVNRVLTDHLSAFLFCPTTQAIRNLVREGITNGRKRLVRNVGDVMYDSILHYSKLAQKRSTILKDLALFTPNSTLRDPNYYLATLHRAENTDNHKRLRSILRALRGIGQSMPVILPLHPRTRKMLKAYHLMQDTRGLRIIEPVSYLDMLQLMKYARVILTDSGGVQKEAFWLKVPCITLREETEWVETVKSGWNVLAGPGVKEIVEAASRAGGRKRNKRGTRLFGDGNASRKIMQCLMKSM
jgi:UDP-GlcNAc3NAcA epimerase